MRFFKSLILLTIIVFCNSQAVNAQEPSYLKFGGGLNAIDNSNGFNIFWDIDQFEFSNPYFMEVEGRFSEDMSFSIMATSNVFQLKRLNNEYGLCGIKAEFEAEGSSFRDLVRLRRITDQ